MYEKAAKNLEGLAKVAAVNCDDDANKAFCGNMGVQGFPTLKIVRPSTKKGGRPAVEDYEGARTAKAMVDAVVDRINNHVKRLTDKDLDAFLEAEADKPKALLFTDKGTTSALLKSIAIDFLGSVQFGQVRNKESAAVERFAVVDFPKLVLLPAGGADPVVYDGEMKKGAMVKFLSQAAEPNPDAAPPAAASAKPKSSSSTKKTKPSTKSSESSSTSTTAEDEESSSSGSGSSSTATTSEASAAETMPPIAKVTDAETLVKECLSPKSRTCVLALVPAGQDEEAGTRAAVALASLAEIAHRHALGQRHLFPIFAVDPAGNDAAAAVVRALGLKADDIELMAINARRNWWRRFAGANTGVEAVESWIDAIRMGEGAKNKIPDGLIADEDEAAGIASSESKSEPESQTSTSSSTSSTATAATSSEAQEEAEPSSKSQTSSESESSSEPKAAEKSAESSKEPKEHDEL